MDQTPLARGRQAAERILSVMARLRDPEKGCPWDLEQDHRTLRPYLLEEAYEVLEALDAEDDTALCEELGDLLLQVVFHAQMAADRGAFGFAEVADGIAAKLEERHPHIFGDVQVSGSAEVVKNWEAIKAAKKARDSVLDGVPAALPALTRAARVQDKAASVGFDWDNASDVGAKIVEEAGEFASALESSPERAASEFGDLLFALVNWARKMKLDPESELRQATTRFGSRFRRMEAVAKGQERPLRERSQAELEALWAEAKRAERAAGE